jgi:hypothetical protein
MNDKKQTVTIEVPAPPDGWEYTEYRTPNEGENYLRPCGEIGLAAFDFTNEQYLIARRKQSLASWANEQPDLQAYARLFPDECPTFWKHEGDWECCAKNWPKPPCDGRITTKNGKWVDA